MAHPYAKHAAHKVGKVRAKSYQSGGSVDEDRQGNYALGLNRLSHKRGSWRMPETFEAAKISREVPHNEPKLSPHKHPDKPLGR